jgi:RimJ/RimL family protein N-acetyltransferase
VFPGCEQCSQGAFNVLGRANGTDSERTLAERWERLTTRRSEQEATPVIYGQREHDGQQLVLRDLEPADIDALVAYWHDADPEYLDFLGVDRDKLGTADDTRRRFESLIRTGEPDQERIAFVSTLGGVVTSYTNFHLVGPDENYMHAHIIRPAARGKGLASSSFANLMGVVFREFPQIDQLLLVTQPHNEAINRMLTKVGLTFERRWYDDPDGLPRPGWFNLFRFTRQMVESFLAPTREAVTTG